MRKLWGVIITSLLLGGVAQAQFSASSNTRITIRETSKPLPIGLWSVGSLNDQFTIQKNTSVTGNFGTTVSVFLATSSTVTITAPSNVWTLTFPTTLGVSGQALVTNGAGVASWATVNPPSTVSVDVMRLDDSNPPTETFLGNNIVYEWPNSGTKYAYFKLIVPQQWNASSNFTFQVDAGMSSSVASQNVKLCIDFDVLTNGSSLTASGGTSVCDTFVWETEANIWRSKTGTNLKVTSAQAATRGNQVIIRLWRDNTVGTNHSGSFRLDGLEARYN